MPTHGSGDGALTGSTPRVYWRILNQGSIPTQVAQAVHHLRQHAPPGWDIDFYNNPYAVPQGRNNICRAAYEGDYEFVVMTDHDVIPGLELFTLPQRNLPIVAGLVPLALDGFLTTNAYRTDSENFYSITEWTHERMEVAAVGAGILCLRRDVLEDTRLHPLFEFELDSWGCVKELGGEDVNFCLKARRQGYEIILDPTVQGEHLRTAMLLKTLSRYCGDNEAPPTRFEIGLNRPDLAGRFTFNESEILNHG